MGGFSSISLLIIILFALLTGIKTSLGASGFILARATLPRLPYSGLIGLGLLKLLPTLFGIILIVIAIISLDFFFFQIFCSA